MRVSNIFRYTYISIFSHVLIDYVLQRALMVVDGPQRDALIGKIKPQLANMRRYSSAYSKHLVSSTFSLY